MGYRRRPSPLHAARAAVGCGACGALVLLALLFDHPLVLGAVLVAVVGMGLAAGVARDLGRALLLAVPFALLIAVVNPIVSQQGLTVIGWFEPPLVGRVDITLEASVYGGVLGLRAVATILAFVLYSAAVDPDEMLRLFRRVSFRSALTATLATRMVPVLQRDGRRMADAQRCRPGPAPSRMTIVRAVAGGALDRAIEVAAALEVRGYGSARIGRTGRQGRDRRPWSRHDLAFGAAALALLALAVGGRIVGAAAFEAYPRLDGAWDAATWAFAAAIVAIPLLPFLDRRGIPR